jgi:Zn-dependent peptidase ImmA (M78 family)/DNA-binding XRE family transcriptional regulator
MATRISASIGGRIRELRERRELSQSALAARLDRTQGSISSWEAGRRTPSVDDIAAVADALEVPIAELFAEPAVPSPTKVLLRAEASRVLVGGERFARELESFAERIARQRVPTSRFETFSRDPERAARELLAQANVESPPVHLPDIVKGCGVRLLGWDFQRDVSGVYVALEDGPAIGFNRKHAAPRARFTVGHELGHHLLGHGDDVHIDFDLALPAFGEPPGYDPEEERAANRFSAELLMPARMVSVAAAENPDPRLLAKRFRVSQEAMGFRLGALGLA